mmetsp:Transcript_46454/g.100924  ORF Transcript_46454/g.100924 Transcript_46454/m.100924 type:complete len:228 (-) Transcript_46454:394-1077(-)
MQCATMRERWTWRKYGWRFSTTSSAWLHGTSSRPVSSCTPMPGPVAYQVHPLGLTALVISLGLVQLMPRSLDSATKTRRVSIDCAAWIAHSASSAWFEHMSRVTLCVKRSHTSVGLPTVAGYGSESMLPVITTVIVPHVRPSSSERRMTMSIVPASCQSCRPSQRARRTPPGSASSDGIRKTREPSIPGLKSASTVTGRARARSFFVGDSDRASDSADAPSVADRSQ